jgi:ribonucleoside-diphosphate reductase alpha chain
MYQTTRQRLPNSGSNETFAFRWGGLDYVATISRFSDGRLSEIFLSDGKANIDSDAIARDAGVTCSIPLQQGAYIEVLRGALLRDSRGQAASPLGVALDTIAGDDGGTP